MTNGSTSGTLPPPGFFRDIASGRLPDGGADMTEGVYHFGSLHLGKGTAPNSRFWHEAICSFTGNGTFQQQVITTKIPLDSAIMPSLYIRGYNYGTGENIDIQICFYTYNVPSGAIAGHTWISRGAHTPSSIRIGYDGGFIVIELNWPSPDYYQRWFVSAYCDGNNGSQKDEYFDGWTAAIGALSASATNIIVAKQTYIGATATPPIISAYSTASYSLPGGFTPDPCRYAVIDTAQSTGGAAAWFDVATYRFTPQRAGWWDVMASYRILRGPAVEAGLSLRRNGVVVANVDGVGLAVAQTRKLVSMNGSTDYLDAVTSGGAANAATQTSADAFFQARWVSP